MKKVLWILGISLFVFIFIFNEDKLPNDNDNESLIQKFNNLISGGKQNPNLVENLINNTEEKKFTKKHQTKLVLNEKSSSNSSGKKELYQFCQNEGFSTNEKGIEECGLLIQKRLLDDRIDINKINFDLSTNEILNKLEEQQEILNNLEKREKIKKMLNIFRVYKDSGVF